MRRTRCGRSPGGKASRFKPAFGSISLEARTEGALQGGPEYLVRRIILQPQQLVAAVVTHLHRQPVRQDPTVKPGLSYFIKWKHLIGPVSGRYVQLNQRRRRHLGQRNGYGATVRVGSCLANRQSTSHQMTWQQPQLTMNPIGPASRATPTDQPCCLVHCDTLAYGGDGLPDCRARSAAESAHAFGSACRH